METIKMTTLRLYKILKDKDINMSLFDGGKKRSIIKDKEINR
ncbi:hypothetical protein [Campylobacter portucalensis]|nr:hypothetical protein [Campylobacter portucalensis]